LNRREDKNRKQSANSLKTFRKPRAFIYNQESILGNISVVERKTQIQMIMIDWKVLMFTAVIPEKQGFPETTSLRFQRSNRRRSTACE